jgi:multidrug resistance efflux pump
MGILIGAAAVGLSLFFIGCSRKPVSTHPGDARDTGRTGIQQGGAAQIPVSGPQGGESLRTLSIAVRATKVPGGILRANRDTAGVVSPALQSSVAAGVGGIVAKVVRQAGDWVAAGELVVQIDDTALRLSVTNAEAALESARLNLRLVEENASQSNARLELQLESAQAGYDSAKRFFESQKALFDLGGVSAQALDQARSQFAAAQANLENAKLALDQNQRGVSSTPSQSREALGIAVRTAENNLMQARINLEKASIVAPFAGQIASISAAPGMYLGQNSAAFVLVGPERQVAFSISPSDAAELRQGTRLTFEAEGGKHLIVVKQAPTVPVNGMLAMTASIEGGSSLPFGMVGKISYVVPLARGTLVPVGSIGTIENRNYLFIIKDDRVITRNIKVLATSGAVAAVDGVAAGEVVVLNPPPGLVDGQEVKAAMIEVPDLVTAGRL